MEKYIVVIGIILLMMALAPIVSGGYICDGCGGDGWYWYGGEKQWCPLCGGDGCIENPTPANAWKDDCSCGCDDGGSSGSDSVGINIGTDCIIMIGVGIILFGIFLLAFAFDKSSGRIKGFKTEYICKLCGNKTDNPKEFCKDCDDSIKHTDNIIQSEEDLK